MTNTHSPRLTTLILLLAFVILSHTCSVCQKCTNCGADILADTYLDRIDALLQNKFQNIGYPLQIERSANTTHFTYSMVYSNGLSAMLALTLSNAQIQLIDYSLNSQPKIVSGIASSGLGGSVGSSSSLFSQKNSIGASLGQNNSDQSKSSLLDYQSVPNYQSNTVINSILKSLSTSSFNFNSSQLASAQQANTNGLNSYKIVLLLSQVGSIKLQKPLYYQFIINQTETKQYRIINSSYNILAASNLVNLTLSDIGNDSNIQQIALFLMQQKYSMLPSNSQVVLVARDFPYYRIVFDNQRNAYATFNLIYNFYNADIQVTSININNFATTQKLNTTQQTQNSTNPNSTTTSNNQIIQSPTPQIPQSTQATQKNQDVKNNGTQVQNLTLTPAKLINDSSESQSTLKSNPNIQNISSQSSNASTNNIQTAQTITVQSNEDQNVVNVDNLTFLRASSSLANQNYVVLYLKYLASANPKYSSSNLIGIYVNSLLPNSLLFRYQFNGQNLNQITTTSEIQQILTQNLTSTVKTQAAANNTSINKTQSDTAQPSNVAPKTNSPQQKQVIYGGITYQLATSAASSQSYITQYLAFLASNFKSYDMNNLVGIYVNPQNTNSLLFRYKNNDQFINLVSNASEIQKMLKLPQGQTDAGDKTDPQAVTKQTETSINTNNMQSIIKNSNTAANIPSVVTTSMIVTSNTPNVSGSNNNQDTSGPTNLSQINLNLVPAKLQPTTSQPSSQNSQQSATQQTSSQKNSSKLPVVIQIDPQCLCYDKDKCIRCAHRFILSNNRCIEVPKQCLSYDVDLGVCRSCVPGYQIKGGFCQFEETTAYYFNNQCFSCFGNYRIINQRCVYSPGFPDLSVSMTQAKNVLCATWRGDNCVQCMPGTFLSSRRVCELIDPFCAIFDYVLQSCNSCERGYSLRNGRCFKQ